MKLNKGIVFILLFLCAEIFPLFAQGAASTLQYSAWIAYWKKDGGAAEVLTHPQVLKEVSPFGYSVKADGTIADTAKIDQSPWTSLFQGVGTSTSIIPTVMWSDTNPIFTILSHTASRTAHIKQIVDLVNSHNFAGIDIDYENKKLATRTYFSLFLKQLSTALHANRKSLVCSIESRTPLASRFVKIPNTVEYVNDYSVIGSSCDEVRVMAYDQGNIDLSLDKSKGSANYYMPIADPDWVSKVLTETLKSIPRSKVVLGVATYGREYQVSTSTSGFQYKILKSISYKDALSLAQSVGSTPYRNNAGELSFSFASSTYPGGPLVPYFVTYTDSISLADKVALAKQYKLKGVALFKIDGDDDQNIWNILN
jgi:spore germination protein